MMILCLINASFQTPLALAVEGRRSVSAAQAARHTA
jgi:hypothetical protein